MKKVLVMCTGNSCRSIIAEALINAFVDDVEAKSCGVAPSGRVNPNAKKVLQAHGIWNEKYHSKHLDDIKDEPFDLVVTVCSHAEKNCPVFPYRVKTIHIGFEDPDGQSYEVFEQTYDAIKQRLLAQIKAVL